jgi:hypothetical protein
MVGGARHYDSGLGNIPKSMPAPSAWCSNISPFPIYAALQTEYADNSGYFIDFTYP